MTLPLRSRTARQSFVRAFTARRIVLACSAAVLLTGAPAPCLAAQGAPTPAPPGDVVAAWSLLVDGHPAEAEHAFRAIVLVDPINHEAHRGLAESLRAQGRFDEARHEFVRAFALGSENPDTRRGLAEVYSYDRKHRDQGVSVLRRMLAADPADRASRLALARAHKWGGDLGRSRAQYDTLLAVTATTANASEERQLRLERAEVLSWSGHLNEAESEYRRVLDADPSSPAARIGLGEVALWRGQSLRGHRSFANALQTPLDNPLASRAHLGEGRYRIETGQLGRARDELIMARALDGSNVEATRWLDRLDEAIESPELQVGGYRLEDSNDFTRSVLQVPVRLRDRSFSLAAGVVVARYASKTRAINRTSLPLQVGLALGDRLRVDGGYAWHVYGDPHGIHARVPDTDTGFARARLVLTETTKLQASCAIRDFVDRADPFEPLFYNNISDIDVVVDGIRLVESTGRIEQALGNAVDVALEASYGDQNDSNTFVTGTGTLRWFPEAFRGVALRAGAYLLDYAHEDPRYFSPESFESYFAGVTYAASLASWWSFRTEHDLLVQPDADEPIGSEHFLETTLRLGGTSYVVLDGFYLQAPPSQNPDGNEDRYTITRFGARYGVRFR